MINSTFYNNLINFPNVDFYLILFYILHLTSVVNSPPPSSIELGGGAGEVTCRPMGGGPLGITVDILV